VIWTEGLWAGEGVLGSREHLKYTELKYIVASVLPPEEGQMDGQQDIQCIPTWACFASEN